MTTPTQRSLARLRKTHSLVEVVEKWNHVIKQRRDLFRFADIIAVDGNEVLLVQTTSGNNMSARINKLLAEPNVGLWLASGSRGLEVHGWRKTGAKGKRKFWSCHVAEIAMAEADPGEWKPCVMSDGDLLK